MNKEKYFWDQDSQKISIKSLKKGTYHLEVRQSYPDKLDTCEIIQLLDGKSENRIPTTHFWS